MCGVFGFISAGKGSPIDTTMLRKIAAYNEERRGGHAWGVSWVDQAGKLRSYKAAGRIDGTLLAALTEDSKLLIGHLRWTTQGTEHENINNHPHPCDGGWIVHNGVLPDYHDIRETFSVPPNSDCDSEMLAIALAEAPGETIESKASWMLKACQPSGRSPLVVLGLWHDRLIAIRQGNPLSAYITSAGTYLSSLTVPGITEKLDAITDDTVTEWHPKGSRYQRSVRKLEQRAHHRLASSKFGWWGN